MKKLTFSITILVIIIISQVSFAQWVQVSNGMTGATVLSLANSGNNIFAGTWPNSGIYLSTNNGESWAQSGLNNRTIYSLAVTGINIYAGTDSNGVYLSTNNGTTWAQTSLNNRYVFSLAVSGNNILAGTENYGVYLSTNNGTSWTQTALNNRTVLSLAVSGNNIFAGTESFPSYGVYLSSDNGTTWTQTSFNNRDVYSIAVSGNNIFAGTSPNSGVYLSTNSGTNWTQTSLNNRYVWSLVVSGNNIFAGTDGYGLYLSTNNGTSWTQRSEGLVTPPTIYSFCILNNYIFAGSLYNSVYRRPLGELIGIQTISNEVPQNFSLSQNYPNPFNPTTKIRFDVPANVKSQTSNVKLIVYNILGKEIASLVNEQLNAGTYEVDFNASNYPSGVYYYRLQVNTPRPDKSGHPSKEGNFIETKKMILIK